MPWTWHSHLYYLLKLTAALSGTSSVVCHAFVSITFAFSCCSRSVEGRTCRSDRRETGNQIGQIGKTENSIGYQIWKPVNTFRENRKPNAKKRNIHKPQAELQSDERLAAKLRVTENRCVLFDSFTYIYIYIGIYIFLSWNPDTKWTGFW